MYIVPITLRPIARQVYPSNRGCPADVDHICNFLVSRNLLACTRLTSCPVNNDQGNIRGSRGALSRLPTSRPLSGLLPYLEARPVAQLDLRYAVFTRKKASSLPPIQGASRRIARTTSLIVPLGDRNSIISPTTVSNSALTTALHWWQWCGNRNTLPDVARVLPTVGRLSWAYYMCRISEI